MGLWSVPPRLPVRSCLLGVMVAAQNAVLTCALSVFCAVDHRPVFDQYGKLEIVKGR